MRRNFLSHHPIRSTILLLGSTGLVFFGIQWAIVAWQDATPPQPPTLRRSADQVIEELTSRLARDPKNLRTRLALSDAYIQKVRETADAAYYKNIDALFDELDASEQGTAEVLTTRAIVAASRHDFRRAFALSTAALKKNPDRVATYGILFDAEMELGKYPEAIATLQTMTDKRPDYSVWSRISFARELHGDIAGAKQALSMAIDSGAAYPENLAWGYVELGTLELRDNLDAAAKNFEGALTVVPEYPPALAGLGKVAVARGEYESSKTQFQTALNKLPIAQYAVDLGDVYTKLGDHTKATQQYFIAKLAFEKSASSGVNTDLETALFLADHDLELSKALEKARAAYQARPSIHGADVLSWALYKSGDLSQAARFSREARRLGDTDPIILFHAGMIAAGRGENKEAKRLLEKAVALSTLPLLYTDTAREQLKGL